MTRHPGECVMHQVRSQVWRQVWYRVDKQACDWVRLQVRDQVRNPVWIQVRIPARNLIGDQLEEELQT